METLYNICLCLHGCTTNRAEVGPFVAHIDDIKAQIQHLKDKGYVFVPPSQYQRWQNGTQSFTGPIACVIYDDGLLSNELIVPWHVQTGTPCGLALITRKLRKYTPDIGFLTWGQIRGWAASGLVEVVCHTHDIHQTALNGTTGANATVEPILQGPFWIDEGEYLFIRPGDTRWYWDQSYLERAMSLPLLGTDQFDGVTPISTSITMQPRFTGPVRALRLFMGLTAPVGSGYNARVVIVAAGMVVFDGVIGPKDYGKGRVQWPEREWLNIQLDTSFNVNSWTPVTIRFNTVNTGTSMFSVCALPIANDGQYNCVTNARGFRREGTEGAPERWWQYIDHPAGDPWPVVPMLVLCSGQGRSATREEFKAAMSRDIRAAQDSVARYQNAIWDVVNGWEGVWELSGARGFQPVGWNAPNKVAAMCKAKSPIDGVVESMIIRFGPKLPVGVPQDQWGPVWEEVQLRNYNASFEILISGNGSGPWQKVGEFTIWEVWRGAAIDVVPTLWSAKMFKYVRIVPINRGPSGDFPERQTVYTVSGIDLAIRRRGNIAPYPTQIAYPFGAYEPNWYDNPPAKPQWKDISNTLREVFLQNGIDFGYSIQAIRNVTKGTPTSYDMRQSEFIQGRVMLLGDTPLQLTKEHMDLYCGIRFPDVQHKGVEWQVSLEGDILGHGTVRALAGVLDYFAFDAWSFSGAGRAGQAEIWTDTNPVNDGTTWGGNRYFNERTYLQARGAKALIIINNNWGTGEPNSVVAADILDHADAYIAEIVRVTKEGGWDGVTSNIEATPANYRNRATAFYKKLGRACHAEGLLLHITAPATTGTSYDTASWTGWCDHAAIIPYVDGMKIMSYTETGEWSAPGPAAPDNFWDLVYAHTAAIIPDQFKRRIMVGGRAFGHVWYPDSNSNHYIAYAEGLNNAITRSVPVTIGSTELNWVDTEAGIESWAGSPLTLARSQDTAAEMGFGGVGVWKIDDGDIAEFYPDTRMMRTSAPLLKKPTGVVEEPEVPEDPFEPEVPVDLTDMTPLVIYSWAPDCVIDPYTAYRGTITRSGDNLRMTNSESSGADASLVIPVVAGRSYTIHVDLAGKSADHPAVPSMHFGYGANNWGGYGFNFPMGDTHQILAVDDALVIYFNSRQNDAVGSWIEVSNVIVTEWT